MHGARTAGENEFSAPLLHRLAGAAASPERSVMSGLMYWNSPYRSLLHAIHDHSVTSEPIQTC